MYVRITRTRVILAVLVLTLVFVAAAIAGKPDWYSNDEKTTNDIAAKAQHDAPYPISKMNHFQERDALIRRLLSYNKANKITYVYIMSFGKFVGYYVAKGGVFSTQSQLTVTDQTWDCGSSCEAVAASMGDNGTYGPEEGGDKGVFFTTVGGVLVETDLDFVESDQPLHIDVPNLLK